MLELDSGGDQESKFLATAPGSSYEHQVWKLLNLICKELFGVI